MRNKKPMHSNDVQLSQDSGCKWFKPTMKQTRPIVLQLEERQEPSTTKQSISVPQNISDAKPNPEKEPKPVMVNKVSVIMQPKSNEINGVEKNVESSNITKKEVQSPVSNKTPSLTKTEIQSPSKQDDQSQATVILPKKRKREIESLTKLTNSDPSTNSPLGKRVRREVLPSVTKPVIPTAVPTETPPAKKDGRKRQKSTDKWPALHIKCCNPDCKRWRKVILHYLKFCLNLLRSQ